MITKSEVEHIAKLAKLDLSEKEIRKYQQEFLKILDYVEKLKELNLPDQAASSARVYNIIRKDEVSKFNQKLINGYLKVKPIFKWN